MPSCQWRGSRQWRSVASMLGRCLSCLGISWEVRPRKSRQRAVPKQWRRGRLQCPATLKLQAQGYPVSLKLPLFGRSYPTFTNLRVRLVNFFFPSTIQLPTFFTTSITAPCHQLTPPDASKLVDNIFSSPSSTTLRGQSKMSQKKSQKLQRPQQNWRGDADIISMETRILPKNLVPSFSKRVPQVQIPQRTASQSSATTPTSAVSLFSSWKRRQSSDSAMDPTPSKRHRVDLIVPKSEPDDSVTAALPYGHAPSSTATQRVGSNAAESEASCSTGHRPETTSPEPANQSYVQ